MRTLGTLKPQNSDDPLEELVGNVSTHGFSASLIVSRIMPEQQNPKAPTHEVFGVNADGEPAEIGVAWEKTLVRGEQAGSHFLSVEIDAPTMERHLCFAVFPAADGRWEAKWRRRQVKTA